MPRRRLQISEKDKEFPARFALHLRRTMEREGWTSQDVADRVTSGGVTIGDRGVDAWLRGERLPKLKDIERVGVALGYADYRELLPPPIVKPKAKS